MVTAKYTFFSTSNCATRTGFPTFSISSKISKIRARVRSLPGTFLCIMLYEINKMTDPSGPRNNFFDGILKIDNDDWCDKYVIVGKCLRKCLRFRDDDIQDDVNCATRILREHEFYYWPVCNTICKYPQRP